MVLSTVMPYATGSIGYVRLNRSAFQLGDGLSVSYDPFVILAVAAYFITWGVVALRGTDVVIRIKWLYWVAGIAGILETIGLWTGVNDWGNNLKAATGIASASSGPGLWMYTAGFGIALVASEIVKRTKVLDAS